MYADAMSPSGYSSAMVHKKNLEYISFESNFYEQARPDVKCVGKFSASMAGYADNAVQPFTAYI